MRASWHFVDSYLHRLWLLNNVKAPPGYSLCQMYTTTQNISKNNNRFVCPFIQLKCNKKYRLLKTFPKLLWMRNYAVDMVENGNLLRGFKYENGIVLATQNLRINKINKSKTSARFYAQYIHIFVNRWHCSPQVVHRNFSDGKLQTCSYRLYNKQWNVS